MPLHTPARGRIERRIGLAALAGLVVLAGVIALLVSTTSSMPRARRRAGLSPAGTQERHRSGSRFPRPVERAAGALPHAFAVGLRLFTFTDGSRSITLPNGGRRPRRLLTLVRYPATGAAGGREVRDGRPLRSAGPFPLVVFGHGFTLTPGAYERLLRAWAGAGYVVAAPLFPLENARAPGGPNEADLPNQPADMSFVITRLLAQSAARSGPLAGLVDPRQIAVAGHSDGGETALAVAYDTQYIDRRITAAVLLSGARVPAGAGFVAPPDGPPLLATQGTADTINPPSSTASFFRLAHRPKYLLSLLGAGHLPPYSSQHPQLEIVARTTIAFFDLYLKRRPGSKRRLLLAGEVPRRASLRAEP